MKNGEGLENVFPPIRGADLIRNKPEVFVNIVWNGIEGSIQLNGVTYSGVMQAQNVHTEDLRKITNFVYHEMDVGPYYLTETEMKRLEIKLKPNGKK